MHGPNSEVQKDHMSVHISRAFGSARSCDSGQLALISTFWVVTMAASLQDQILLDQLIEMQAILAETISLQKSL